MPTGRGALSSNDREITRRSGSMIQDRPRGRPGRRAPAGHGRRHFAPEMASGVCQMIQYSRRRKRPSRPIINRHYGHQESRRVRARHHTQHAKILKHVIGTISQGLIEGQGDLAAKLKGLAVVRPILECRPPTLPAPCPAPRGEMQSISIVYGNLGERSAGYPPSVLETVS